MKTVCIAFCICLSVGAKAQISALGKTKQKVKEYIAGSNYIFQDSSATAKDRDTVITLEYHPNDTDTTGAIPIAYTFKNDICVSFMFHSYLSDLPNLIASMKSAYIRIDDLHWINKTATIEATLWKDDRGFYMDFKQL